MAFEDEQNPWGKKQGPPTPEEMIASLIKKVKEAFDGGGSGGNGGEGGSGTSPLPGSGIGKLATIIVVIMLLSLANSAYFTIKPGEEGVVLRFGKYIKTANPGLNFKIPLVDEVGKVDVKTVRKEEFGFRTRRAGQRTQYEKRGFDEESLMLTGDKNVLVDEFIEANQIAHGDTVLVCDHAETFASPHDMHILFRTRGRGC